jgi:hypothetical protein
MGRARSRTQAVTNNFDAVLGLRRGSVAAQKQRDHAEEVERLRRQKQEELERPQALQDFVSAIIRDTGKQTVAAVLSGVYTRGDYEDAEAYEQLVTWVTARVGGSSSEVALIVAHGDPRGWPGLTAPVLDAIIRYFADVSWEDIRGNDISAYHVMNECFIRQTRNRAPYLAAYYTRLAPLCQGLAHLIAQQPPDQDLGRGTGMFVGNVAFLAVEAIFQAPAQAIAGPLRCWVQALAQRFDNGNCSDAEMGMLRDVYTKYMGDAAFDAAFAPIAQRLS